MAMIFVRMIFDFLLYSPIWSQVRAGRQALARAKDFSLKIALLVVDMQGDFVYEEWGLWVKGAIQNLKNLVLFINTNLWKIDAIFCTVDSHIKKMIFFTSWWVYADNQHEHPKPFTTIERHEWKLFDKKSNRELIPLYEIAKSYQYVYFLDDNDKRPLVLWPFHTIIFTLGHLLAFDLIFVLQFFAAAKRTKINLLFKGIDPNSDMFGAFYKVFQVTKEALNQSYLEELATYDRIYVAGEARNYCVLDTILQILKFAPWLATKIFILEPCMADIPGMEEYTQLMFDDLRARGVNFVDEIAEIEN